MLAEDIARYVGVLSMELLDRKVIPFDLYRLGVVMKEWFENELMDAMTEYDCNPNSLGPQNYTDELFGALDEFESVAMELNEFILEIANVTDDFIEVDSIDGDETDSLIEQTNDLLSMISKGFVYDNGIPDRIWYKNMLWAPANEDESTNVFPYIFLGLKSGCDEQILSEGFDVTINLIENVTAMLTVHLDEFLAAGYN